MSDQTTEYLVQQIFVEKNIVTFRSLSRALSVHVNTAKNELTRYHAAFRDAPERAFATYLISGVLHPPPTEEDQNQDLDVRDAAESFNSVSSIHMTLVDEDALETARSRYARIFSTHMYSLSPSPIREPALLREPARIVHEVDKQRGPEFALIVGRVTGPHVQRGPVKKYKAPPPAVASSSKSKLPALAKPANLPTMKAQEENEGSKPQALKPKPSGKLDFSKASVKPKAEAKAKDVRSRKPKEENPTKEEAKPARDAESTKEIKVKGKMSDSASETDPGATTVGIGAKFGPPRGAKKVARTSVAKRGMKRKSAIALSDSDEAVPSPPAPSPPPASSPASSVAPERELGRGRRGVVLDSDEEAPVRAKLAKAKTLTANERAVAAMMDVDDNTVERVIHTRKPSLAQEEEEEEEEEERPDEDVEMEDIEPVPAPKPRAKRKPKKEVPVGKNGLKKKRVMKSRTTADAKGFIVTEDYSSYESVDEDELELPKAKGKKAGKESESKKKGAPLVRSATNQQSLKNFFAKAK